MSDDLTQFLLARIAEDEAAATAASSAMWLPEDKGITFDWRFEDLPDPDGRARLEANTWANVDHISRWSPTRALAECEAKRELIAYADPYDFEDDGGGMSAHADQIHRMLAAPYADHPDYRDEWRP